ncbi:hypothetical protein [Halioxenophilus sp. WMMB6]|uniref:hypothetical protein n=1 Tax=Halioxenophilus sp. WMMB6 TaxID=3073815 RepID=UPI00295E9004|nr:hypothetical protein [Halioxenophilus sp. WMMB6]
MLAKRLISPFVVAILMAGGFACADNQDQLPESSSAPGQGLRLGSDYQKPGAPVEFQHSYDGKTKISEPEIIDLMIIPSFDLEQVTVTATATDGLTLTGFEAYTGEGTEGEPILLTGTVASNQAGRYHLNLFVTSENGNESASRSFTLTVVVGDVAPISKPTVLDASGEAVRVLNAEEKLQ